MIRPLTQLEALQQQIVACNRCPRLREWCSNTASIKRRAFLEWEYWGRPVPAFGDPRARLLIIGLAPAAHGANRTGRMFTGDRSGDFLYRALYETGFASQPTSTHRADGLELRDAYITASVRCAPPDNKPAVAEIAECRPYLEREMELMPQVQVVVALGRLAFFNYLTVLRARGRVGSLSHFQFAHDKPHRTAPGDPLLISSYHPSQQNTSTGRLTAEMLRRVFERARAGLKVIM